MIRGQMFDRAEPDPNPVALVTPIPAPSSAELTTSRILDALALLVVGIVGVLALLTFRDYGLSWDDYAHAEYGDLLLKLYASGFSDQRALSWVNLYYLRRWLRLACGARRRSCCRSRCSRPAADRRGGGHRRTPGHVAHRPANGRAARGPYGARAARRLSALLRPYVHERRRIPPSRSQWRSSCSARCAPSSNIRNPCRWRRGSTVGHRLRPCDRLPHHGRASD